MNHNKFINKRCHKCYELKNISKFDKDLKGEYYNTCADCFIENLQEREKKRIEEQNIKESYEFYKEYPKTYMFLKVVNFIGGAIDAANERNKKNLSIE